MRSPARSKSRTAVCRKPTRNASTTQASMTASAKPKMQRTDLKTSEMSTATRTGTRWRCFASSVPTSLSKNTVSSFTTWPHARSGESPQKDKANTFFRCFLNLAANHEHQTEHIQQSRTPSAGAAAADSTAALCGVALGGAHHDRREAEMDQAAIPRAISVLSRQIG